MADPGRQVSHTRQLAASLLAAAVIVALAILVVTLTFGSTSVAEREAEEERIELLIERDEERREAAKDRRDGD